MTGPRQASICTLGLIVNELQLCRQLISRGGKLSEGNALIFIYGT